MAIARCETCGKPRANKPPEYAAVAYKPLGYPDTALVCGTKGCEKNAQVWLKEDEKRLYDHGQRVFDLRTNSAKVRLM
jgi:hypothetical protein